MKNQADLNARTLKEMPQNTAAVLCYVGTWITGIIFLALEQKNRFVRFHALQSIIVFGTLTIAGAIFGNIPFFGPAFGWLIFAVGFALWLILIIKASNGETFKLPWAGDLAERIANENTTQPANYQVSQSPAPAAAEAPQAASIPTAPTKQNIFRAKYYSSGARIGRVIGSSFSIAWSIALMVFFNFYNQYVAYYQSSVSLGNSHWQIYTFVNSDINLWLPILNTVLAISIAGHILMIAWDKYIVRQLSHIILSILGLVTVVSLLAIFPFNFEVIPNSDAAFWVQTGVTLSLVLIAVGFGIGALVRAIQLIVNVVEGKY